MTARYVVMPVAEARASGKRLADDINRAAAIRICATAASTPGFVVDYGWSHIYGASEPAWELALAAYLAANESAARWADAEAMLRSGWAP